MPQLTVADVLAIIVVIGGLIGWLLKVERTMSKKVAYSDLEKAIDKLGAALKDHADADSEKFDRTIDRAESIVSARHLENQAVLEKQDVALDRISKKLDEQVLRASKFRQEQRTELNSVRLDVLEALRSVKGSK